MDVEDQNSVESTKRTLVVLIGTLLSKYRSQKDANVKEILMLIAALNMLNVSDDHQTISQARRLITGVK